MAAHLCGGSPPPGLDSNGADGRRGRPRCHRSRSDGRWHLGLLAKQPRFALFPPQKKTIEHAIKFIKKLGPFVLGQPHAGLNEVTENLFE